MNFRTVLFCALSLFSCAEHESHNSKSKIINGIEMTDTNYPAVVSFYYFRTNGSRYMCTGTFISLKVMMTASHCLEDVVKVQYGNHITTDFISNEKYDRISVVGKAYDIGFIRFDSNIAPAVMKVSQSKVEVNDKLIMVGFGINEYDTNNNPLPTSKAFIKRIGYNIYKKSDYLEWDVIQFFGRYQNASLTGGDGIESSLGQGDSGGPLIVEGKGIVGIASAQLVSQMDDGTYKNDSQYSIPISESNLAFIKHAKQLNYIDSTIISDPPPPAPEPTEFAIKTLGEDGIYSIKIYNIPKQVKYMTLFWGNSKIPFHRINHNGLRTIETDSWEFGSNSSVKLNAYDVNNKLIQSLRYEIK